MADDTYDPAAIRALAGLRTTRRSDGHLSSVDGVDWVMQRDPGESEADYEARPGLIADGLPPVDWSNREGLDIAFDPVDDSGFQRLIQEQSDRRRDEQGRPRIKLGE